MICLGPEDALDYVNHSRAPEDHHQLAAHLDRCDGCRRLVAEAAAALNCGPCPEPTAVRTLAEGERILDRYRIGRFIARGGMGEVYLAFDTVLGEEVALKTLLPTRLDDERFAATIQDEVRHARRVTHANVCRILEFGLHQPSGGESVPFLTMEFLHGETLAERLRRQGQLPTPEVARILTDILAGLTAIHEAGIVHRDLKPENVFLVPGGVTERAVVMDFGLARRVDGDLLAAGPARAMVAGTPAYMAPEQLAGATPTPAFDIYAFGVLAFELFAGRKPLADETPFAPAPWRRLIRRCLQKDPARRLARVADLGAALGRQRSPALLRSRSLAVLGTAALVVAAVVVTNLASREPATAGVIPGALPTSAGLPPGTALRYNFEHSLQGWMDLRYEYYGTSRMHTTPTTERAFEGRHSMEIQLETSATFTTPTVGVYETFEERLPAGTVITYHLWFPPGDGLLAVQPYVLHHRRGQESPVWGGTEELIWTKGLRPGEWNVITHRVPDDLAEGGVIEVGMEFVTRGAQSMKVYLDAIVW